MKKTIPILFLFVLLGLALRTYNLNFPSIGYHNMKENENLSVAQEMLRTKDFMNKRIYFHNAFEGENAGIKAETQLPMIPYHIILSWKLFGENLWGPRLFNIIFGLLSVLVMYPVAKTLFKSLYPALFSSYLLAIMPLAVFFSRNLQPESPAFFFMLLGSLFYIKFLVSFKNYNLILGGLAFSFAWVYKSSFLIGIIPFLFCIPSLSSYKKKKPVWKYVITFFLSYIGIPIAIAQIRDIGQWQWQGFGLPKGLFDMFSFDYWARNGQMIWWYINKENFTLVFALLALVGMLIAIFKKKGLTERYIMGWVFTVVIYSIIHSNPLSQENFSQMPFLALICISSTYALLSMSEVVKRFLQIDVFLALSLVVACASAPLIYNSLSRLHATAFLGMDVAGESLKEFTKPEERIFLLTHSQGYGIARYARRYMGWPQNLEDFKDKEKNFGVRYICFYPIDFFNALKAKDPALFSYIKNNYHVKEVGLKEEPRQVLYVILEKGAPSDTSQEFLTSFSGTMRLRTIYRMFGKLVFLYTLKPQN